MPADAKQYFNAAVQAERAGRLQEAVRLYKSAARQDAAFRPAFLNLGALYSRHGRPDLAMGFYQRALELGQDDAVYFNLGTESYRLERYEDSAAYLKRALKLNTRLLKGHILLAYVYDKLQQAERAAVYFQNALKLDPGNRMASLGYAVLLAQLDRFEEALAILDLCARRNAGDAGVNNLRAALLLKLNRHDESLAEYQRLARESADYKGFTDFLEKARSENAREYERALAGIDDRIRDRSKRLRARIEARKRRLGDLRSAGVSAERLGIEGSEDIREEMKQDLRDFVDLSFLHLFKGDPDRALQYLLHARKLKQSREGQAPPDQKGE